MSRVRISSPAPNSVFTALEVFKPFDLIFRVGRQNFPGVYFAHVAQSVERFLGKEEVHRFDSGRGLHSIIIGRRP